ncbi:MAG: hypothetical protein KKD01_20225 [Proteobacteria bacterium]|nr:hypothetical protein [Pseudomonadota bacterium]
MGLTQRRTNLTLGSIGSSMLYAVSTEMLYTISTGFVAFEATNLGPHSIFYGSTGVTANSGGLIIANGSKFWDSVVDNFQLYFVTIQSSGVTSNLVIQEYAGN